MKKRIKLTDKELAIGMWVYICLYIETYDRASSDKLRIASLKRRWLERHYKASCTVTTESYYKASDTVTTEPYWEHDCWLCYKYWKGDCLCCPLRTCGTDSLYEGVTEYRYDEESQAKALTFAKRILNIIAETKEAKYEDN